MPTTVPYSQVTFTDGNSMWEMREGRARVDTQVAGLDNCEMMMAHRFQAKQSVFWEKKRNTELKYLTF